MTDRSKTLEVMARGMYDADKTFIFGLPGAPIPVEWRLLDDLKGGKEERAKLLKMAEAALTAYESHLQAEGMAVVPVEPTEDMVECVYEVRVDTTPDGFVEFDGRHARKLWSLTLAASPYGKAVVKEKDDE